MFDTCSGAPWHMQTHLGQSSLIYQWQWSLSDRRLCQALVKKQSNFFLTAFVCANAMETPYLHGDTSDPGTGGIFFLSLERHGWGGCGGSDITSRDCTFQIWWITECQSSTRTNLSGFLLTAQLIVKLLTNKEDSTLDVRTWLSGMKKKMFWCTSAIIATPLEEFSSMSKQFFFFTAGLSSFSLTLTQIINVFVLRIFN